MLLQSSASEALLIGKSQKNKYLAINRNVGSSMEQGELVKSGG